jgi:MFS family permease
MHGLGCGLLLPLIFSIPSQWTRKHRGLATGIVVAGASLGGAVPSLIIQVCSNVIGESILPISGYHLGNVNSHRLPQNGFDLLFCAGSSDVVRLSADKNPPSALPMQGHKTGDPMG